MLQNQSTARTRGVGSDTISRFLVREARLRLVVNELGHRTKNLLAVVQAIANQTAQRSNDLETFRSEFSHRIGALSRSVDILIDQGEQGVSVAELVQRQLAPFANANGTRVVASGPDVLLNQDATQNLGLAFHELATNATKYGALSVPDGAISVDWEVSTAGTEPAHFRLAWREQHGPPVTPPTHHGFGSLVLQRISVATLGGNVKHDFTVSGVSWLFDAAAARVLMPNGTERA